MRTTATTALLLGATATAPSCKIIDDDQPTIGDTDGNDAQACIDGFEELLREGCPPGSYPQVHYDGGSSTVVQLDDPQVAASLGLGLLVDFGVGAGADWVGYGVTQNGDCTLGCFVGGCALGQYGCYATNADGELCAYWCDDVRDPEACAELAGVCLAGGTETGDGGLDDTGTGGSPVQYDCTDWHPERVQSLEGDRYLVPQSLLEMLVHDEADPLIECDRVRLWQGSEGYWQISQMDDGGMLGRLGLRVGDELRTLDDVSLGSLDGWLVAMGELVSDDGSLRELPTSHPGFSLGVRRPHADVVIRFRVVPDPPSGD